MEVHRSSCRRWVTGPAAAAAAAAAETGTAVGRADKISPAYIAA